MLKFISCFLSLTLIFTSVTPSLAQIRPDRRRLEGGLTHVAESTRGDWTTRVERQAVIEQQVREASALTVNQKQADELAQMTLLVHQARNQQVFGQKEENDVPSLDEFAASVKEYFKPQLEKALKKCKTEEERRSVMAQWEDQMDPGALVWDYNKFLAEMGKEKAKAERDTKAYLKQLSEDAVKYSKAVYNYRVKNETNLARSVDPISEFLPLMASLGEEVVSKELKGKAAIILRNRLAQEKRFCKETDTEACRILLRDAAALAVLGVEQKDAFAVAEVLEENYNSPQAAGVIMTIGPMLLAMDDIDPEYRAYAYVMDKIVRKGDEISYWEIVGAPLSAGAWVEAAHTASAGGIFARGYENSFYKDPKATYKNLDNAWVDFGQQVAEESKTHPKLKRVTDALVNGQLVRLRNGKNGIETGTKHNLFLTGLLAGGYAINYQGMVAHEELDAQGRSSRVADTRGDAAGINRKLREANLTQSEWVAYVLYYTGKSDVEPYTERYLRNQLYGAFKRAERPASGLGMEVKRTASQEDLSTYENWQMAKGIANVVDIALVAVTIVFIGVGVVKAATGGIQMVRTVTRATRLARAARAANIERLSSMGKVLRTARYYKYHTYMLGAENTTFVASLTKVKLAPKAKIVPLKTTGNPVTKTPDFKLVDMGDGRTAGLAFTAEQEEAFLAQRTNIAPQTFTSQGAPVANTTKVQPVVNMETSVPVTSTRTTASAGNTPYIRGKVINALGQEVEAWVKNPNYKLPTATNQARQLSWLDKAKLRWEVDFKPVFKDLFSFGTSRYGLAALGPGAAPMTSEAAIARAGNSIEIVQNIRTQQGMFIMEDALRGGSGAAYRTGAVNPGGLAAQQYISPLSTATKGNVSFGQNYAKLVGMGAGVSTPATLPQSVGYLGTRSQAGGGNLYSSILPIPSFMRNWFGKKTAPEQTPLLEGQEAVSVPVLPTLANRFWAKVAKVPGLGFTNRLAQPKSEEVRFTYQQVWFNVKTQTIEYARKGTQVPNGFRVFTVSQSPLFIAPPKTDEGAVQEVIAKVTEDVTKEAQQNGQEVNQKELSARIEKALSNLPAVIAMRKANLVAQYIVNSDQATRDDLLWVLASDAEPSYKILATQKMNRLYMAPVTLQELLLKRLNLQKQVHLKVNLKKDELTDIAERVSSRLQQESLGQLVPQEDPLLSQGLTWHELTNVDQTRLTEALYPQEDMEKLLRYSTKETFGGNIIYDKVLPVYVRDAEGNISETPRLYLLLNKPFVMPRGFRVVIDESGHFKVAVQNMREVESSPMPYNRVLKAIYKWQPNFLDNLPWVKNNPRRLRDWDSSSRRRVFETPLKASELTALNYILSNRQGQVAVLPTAPNDTFEGLMTLVAIIAGADLGASLSSQLKKTFSSEAATTGTSGFGYVSPKIANWFAPLINKYGYYSILRGGFLTMLGISGIGMLSGLWQAGGWTSGMLGTFDPSASVANMILSIAFMSVAMVTASVFSMLAGPILKSTYTDPTVFSSKNMEFTTNKGLSRLLVTAGTGTVFALVKTLFDLDLNWSVLVPAMALLSIAGLVKLKGSRLYKEHQTLKKEKAQLQEATKLSAEQVKAKKAQEKQLKAEMKAKYNDIFAKPLKSITNRLGLIYLTYGNVNSVILGILAGILYSPAAAMYIGGAGLFISWLVRKAADKLIKSRVITEDQLTGISLPLMLAGVATGLFAPFGSASMGIFFGLMYLSTPTFGVSENTRMMNYIASYYKAQREQVNKNEALSASEKEAQLKAINKEQEAMKVQAAASYNSHNSWGVFPILATTFLVGLAKDPVLAIENARSVYQWVQDKMFGLPMTEQADLWFKEAVTNMQGVMQHVSEGLRSAASLFRMGDDAAAFDTEKTPDAALDFAIYRLALLPAVAFGLILNWTNRAMIKQGLQRVFSSIAVSQEDINDEENNDIPADLQIDFKNINATIEEISKEVEELDAAIRPFKDSRTSEERLQGWANRMVWVNNRLTAITRTKPILTKRLLPELRTMRALAKSFMLLLAYNDVSDGLRKQGIELYQSLGSVQLKGEDNSTAQERFDALLTRIQKDVLKGESQWVALVREALAKKDMDAFAALVDELTAGMSSRSLKNQLLSVARDLIDETLLLPLEKEDAGLKYVPELKLSTVDAMRRRLHIGQDPSKGIFAGADVQDYEQAKLLLREMKTMVDEADKGVITNGMFVQFKAFYNKMVKHLQKYVSKNARLGQPVMDSRVMVLKYEADALYRQYLNQEPPQVTFELEPNNEGLRDLELVPVP